MGIFFSFQKIGHLVGELLNLHNRINWYLLNHSNVPFATDVISSFEAIKPRESFHKFSISSPQHNFMYLPHHISIGHQHSVSSCIAKNFNQVIFNGSAQLKSVTFATSLDSNLTLSHECRFWYLSLNCRYMIF